MMAASGLDKQLIEDLSSSIRKAEPILDRELTQELPRLFRKIAIARRVPGIVQEKLPHASSWNVCRCPWEIPGQQPAAVIRNRLCNQHGIYGIGSNSRFV